MQILTFDQLPQGGFAGLIERQFVTDARVFGAHKKPVTMNGIGNFVYLADANFNPRGETRLHPHREVDVISVMADGRIAHEGSLENGTELSKGMVQVQRAGAEGFSHNEVNPDDTVNRMIQLWVLPDELGEPAGYQTFEPKQGERLHFYGGKKGETELFYSKTQMELANLDKGQATSQQGESMMFIVSGEGEINGESIGARTLVKGEDLTYTPTTVSTVIVIYAH